MIRRSYKIIKYCLLILFYVGANNVSAQENDFEIWTSIGINKKLNKKFSISFNEDVRFYDNASRTDKYFSQLSFSYKLKKRIRFKLSYRFINNIKYDASYSFEHQFLGSLKLSQDIKRFKLSYRIRYQQKYSNIYTSENGDIPSRYMRHKIYVDYNIRKSRFTPQAAFEMFQDMGFEEMFYQKKQRYTIACTFESKNKNEATAFITLQREINQVNPVQSIILGLSYDFNL